MKVRQTPSVQLACSRSSAASRTSSAAGCALVCGAFAAVERRTGYVQPFDIITDGARHAFPSMRSQCCVMSCLPSSVAAPTSEHPGAVILSAARGAGASLGASEHGCLT